MELITKRLTEEAEGGRVVDLHRWAHYYVYDVMYAGIGLTS